MAQQKDASDQEKPSRKEIMRKTLPKEELEALIAEQDEKAKAEWQAQREKAAQARLETRLRRAGIPRRFEGKTFASYQPASEAQVKIRDVCKRYASEFKSVMEKGVNVVMTGKPGTGKTHLAVAILQDVIKQGNTGVFISVSEMLRAIRATYSRNTETSEEEAFEYFIEPSLLVLDEVGVSIGDEEKRKAMVFDVINARYNAMKPTILLGNLNQEDLQKYLGVRVWDRILEGNAPVLAFTWDSYRR